MNTIVILQMLFPNRTTTREVHSKEAENSGTLVYDFVLSEEMAVADSNRAGNAREKSLQKTLYQEVAVSFIKTLEDTDEMSQVLSCSSVPEIGMLKLKSILIFIFLKQLSEECASFTVDVMCV